MERYEQKFEEKISLFDVEEMVNELGVDGILEMISEVCYEKAQHVRENWQDEVLAKQWDKLGSIVDSCSAKAGKFRV